jgi:hypothetical protein
MQQARPAQAAVQAPVAPAKCGSAGAHVPGRCSHSPDTINPIIAGDHFFVGFPTFAKPALTNE